MAQPDNWPRATDYLEAMQTPQVCLSDARLRAATIHLDTMGIPLVASGKSAVVFKATVGAEDVAVRCFTRAASDQRLRYRALQAHLGPVLPPHLVGFTYRDQEILVGGTRYPLVEMDWVEGIPLDVWIARSLGRGSDLMDQAAAWLAIVQDMLRRGMAHGDIANDNCLVSGSQLRLIDYDGCFITGLADSPPGESGAQHFQHPSRDGYYAANMDSFPSLVVFLSLLALQSDASLWQHFHTDRNLIFHDTDFTAPGRTRIWDALKENGDARVGALSAALMSMCKVPVTGLPSLPQVTARAGIQVSAQPPWKLVGDVDRVSEPQKRPRATPVTPPAPYDWLQDHVDPATARARSRPHTVSSAEEMPTAHTGPQGTDPESTQPDRSPDVAPEEPGTGDRARKMRSVAIAAVLVILIVIAAVLLLSLSV